MNYSNGKKETYICILSGSVSSTYNINWYFGSENFDFQEHVCAFFLFFSWNPFFFFFFLSHLQFSQLASICLSARVMASESSSKFSTDSVFSKILNLGVVDAQQSLIVGQLRRTLHQL